LRNLTVGIIIILNRNENFKTLLRISMAATFTAIILRAIQSFIERNKNHQHYERYKYQTTINLKTDTATLAGGCFWCVEGQLKQLDGVLQVKSGYTGGTVANPTYKQVCTGATGHAEACNVIYDPTQISYDELLQAFFVAHDPRNSIGKEMI
jgi:peptide-methionine (S)-S-oxide reductase